MINIKSIKMKNTFMKSVIVLMFSQLIIKIIGLIYKLYLTNKNGFGDRGNAIYGAAFQVYAFFLTVCSIGVPNAISKLVAAKVAVGDNRGAYRILKISIVLFGFLGFVCSTIMFFGASYIANKYLLIPETENTIIALSPSVFFIAISSVFRGYFNGKENIVVTANSQNIEQILKTFFTIAIVEQIANISYNDTELMAAGATVATTIASFINVLYLYKYYSKRKKEVWKEVVLSKIQKKEKKIKIIKNILGVSVPIAMCALFSVATKTIDALTIVRILKKTIGEDKATMQYGILTGKIDTLITLPYSFNIAFATALVPSISSAIAKGRINDVKRRIKFSILVTILIGLLFSACISVFANPILEFLFPNASEGTEMLRYSAWTIILVVLIQTINGVLQGLGKVNVPVIAFAIGAVIKLIFNVLLVPKYGVVGAVVSTLLSHIVSLVICFASLKKNIYIKFEMEKFLIKPIIASSIMVLSAYLIYIKIYNVLLKNTAFIVSLIIGFLIYVIMLMGVKILAKEDVFMIPYGQKIYTKWKIIKNRETCRK